MCFCIDTSYSDEISSIPSLPSVFTWSRCQTLSNAFTVSSKIIILPLFFSLHLISWVMLIYFWMLKQSQLPRKNSTWSRCIILLKYIIAFYLLKFVRMFSSVYMRNIFCRSLSLSCFCLVLVSNDVCLIKWIGKYSSTSNF